jgi:hypothetical protein
MPTWVKKAIEAWAPAVGATDAVCFAHAVTEFVPLL